MALTPAGSEPVGTETIRVPGGNAIGVTWRGTQDVIVRKLVAAREVTGRVKTRRRHREVHPRRRGDGHPGRNAICSEGRDYVSVSGSAATVTVSGDQVRALGDGDNTYRVFAPQNIASVLVNGAPASTCRDGSYLLLPCS